MELRRSRFTGAVTFFRQQKNTLKFLLVSILVAVSFFLIYYFNVILHTDIVFTHFFYAPIILSSLWWGRRGMATALLLVLILLSGNVFLGNSNNIIENIARSSMFILVSAVLAVLSERIEKNRNILQKSEKKHFGILENAPFGLLMVNKAGKILYINSKFREIFGYDLSDIPDGKTWLLKAYPDPEYRRVVISKIVDDLKTAGEGEKKPRIFTVTCKDGKKKTISFIAVVFETREYIVSCEDISEIKLAEKEREALILELKDALSKIKSLRGMLPICSSCKKIRDDKGYWEQIEIYIRDHSEAEFSHGICPECAKKLYPDIYKDK